MNFPESFLNHIINHCDTEISKKVKDFYSTPWEAEEFLSRLLLEKSMAQEILRLRAFIQKFNLQEKEIDQIINEINK